MDTRSDNKTWRLWYAWFPVKPRDDGIHWLELVWRRRKNGWIAKTEFRSFRPGTDRDREAASREI